MVSRESKEFEPRKQRLKKKKQNIYLYTIDVSLKLQWRCFNSNSHCIHSSTFIQRFCEQPFGGPKCGLA